MRSPAFIFPALAALSSIATAHAGPVHRNDMPPRLQWEANGGYCGEVSFISAGLYYGQYLSQYDARVCAIGKTPQNKGELLLGLNNHRAARAMHLRTVDWRSKKKRDPRQFLRWVRLQVLKNRPVIIGVYNNEFTLYGRKDPTAGERQYDHIVPISRIDSRGGLRNRLTLSDNGLFGKYPNWPFLFTYSFRGFPGNREQANAPGGQLYTLADDARDFGVAVLGVRDRDGDTLPVRVATNKYYEYPRMAHDSRQRPAPMPLTLTVTVSGLTPGVDYRLYRYDNLDAIPDYAFNSRSAGAAQKWNVRISGGSTFTITQDIQSDEIAAYRCVRASAP